VFVNYASVVSYTPHPLRPVCYSNTIYELVLLATFRISYITTSCNLGHNVDSHHNTPDRDVYVMHE